MTTCSQDSKLLIIFTYQKYTYTRVHSYYMLLFNQRKKKNKTNTDTHLQRLSWKLRSCENTEHSSKDISNKKGKKKNSHQPGKNVSMCKYNWQTYSRTSLIYFACLSGFIPQNVQHFFQYLIIFLSKQVRISIVCTIWRLHRKHLQFISVWAKQFSHGRNCKE